VLDLTRLELLSSDKHSSLLGPFIMTLSLTTLSINGLFATFSRTALDITQLCHYAEWYYTKCCILIIAMLNVIMLTVVWLSVVMLNVVTMNVIMLSVEAPIRPSSKTQ
jgi:hypothetical protein